MVTMTSESATVDASKPADPAAAASLPELSSASSESPAVLGPKPKRPLSAFNLFYRFKRQKVLAAISDGYGKVDKDAIVRLVGAAPGLEGSSSPNATGGGSAMEDLRRRNIRADLEDNLLPRDTRDRQHRTNQSAMNGTMSFLELGKLMNSSWKECDDFAKGVFHELAEEGRELYRRRIKEYNAKASSLGLPRVEYAKEQAGLTADAAASSKSGKGKKGKKKKGTKRNASPLEERDDEPGANVVHHPRDSLAKSSHPDDLRTVSRDFGGSREGDEELGLRARVRELEGQLAAERLRARVRELEGDLARQRGVEERLRVQLDTMSHGMNGYPPMPPLPGGQGQGHPMMTNEQGPGHQGRGGGHQGQGYSGGHHHKMNPPNGQGPSGPRYHNQMQGQMNGVRPQGPPSNMPMMSPSSAMQAAAQMHSMGPAHNYPRHGQIPNNEMPNREMRSNNNSSGQRGSQGTQEKDGLWSLVSASSIHQERTAMMNRMSAMQNGMHHQGYGNQAQMQGYMAQGPHQGSPPQVHENLPSMEAELAHKKAQKDGGRPSKKKQRRSKDYVEM